MPVRQIDAPSYELQLAIVPVLLGAGENLPGGLNLPELGYECVRRIAWCRFGPAVPNKARKFYHAI
jgi:hypothetical protein